MSTAGPTPPPGWYTDPHYPTQQRWWDGTRWTDFAAPGVAPAMASPAAPAGLKSTGIAYLFALLLGGFAAQMFYLRQYTQATIFLILWWGGWMPLIGAMSAVKSISSVAIAACIVWFIVSLCTIPGRVKNLNTTASAPAPNYTLPPLPRKY